MSKYSPLTRYLQGVADDRIALTLDDLQSILGFPLPDSAKRYYAWWDNSEKAGHTQAKAWLQAGFETANVNLKQATIRVDFVRKAEFGAADAAPPPQRHPAIGALKGMITLLPDVDYTQPADPEWGKVYED